MYPVKCHLIGLIYGGGSDMNVFENIQPKVLRLRPFITMEQSEDSQYDMEVGVLRLTGTTPSSVFIDKYNIGYNIRFTLTTCADLTKLIENNTLIAVFDDQDNLQIGDDEGFRITAMTYPPIPDPDMRYYVYQFQTDRPNRLPFKPIK